MAFKGSANIDIMSSWLNKISSRIICIGRAGLYSCNILVILYRCNPSF